MVARSERRKRGKVTTYDLGVSVDFRVWDGAAPYQNVGPEYKVTECRQSIRVRHQSSRKLGEVFMVLKTDRCASRT
jgi:hypothetical protein